MKYIWYIYIVILTYVIDYVKLCYGMFIYRFRHKPRVVVYEYNNDKNMHIENLRYNKKFKHNKYLYWYYLCFVWIWLNDNLNNDIIDNDLSYSLINELSPNDKKTVLNDLNKCGSSKYKAFVNIDKGEYNIDISLLTIWLNMFYCKDTNFRWKFHYTKRKDLVFMKHIGKYRFGWELSDTSPYNIKIYKLVIGAI